MPSFEFCCHTCSYRFEEFKKTLGPPKEAPLCPECGEESFLLIGGDQIIGRVNGNPTTIGQQAELNSKKMGKELVQLKTEEANKRVEEAKNRRLQSRIPKGAKRIPAPTGRPFWRPDGKEGAKPMNIDKMVDAKGKLDKKKVEKYIYTGKK